MLHTHSSGNNNRQAITRIPKYYAIRLTCDVTQKNLGVDRQTIQKELNRLQSENDSLVEKHARKAQEMQEEVINLPNNLEVAVGGVVCGWVCVCWW